MTANRNDGFDRISGCQAVMAAEHWHVHKGHYFMVDDIFLDLANGGTREYLIVVPTLIFPHLRAAQFSLEDSPCTLEYFEGTTVSANGTELTPFNNNRNSLNETTVQVFHTPTVTGDGTQFVDEYIPPTGVGASPGASGSDESEEWILKQGTNYLIRLTNNSGGIIDGGLHLTFYDLKATPP